MPKCEVVTNRRIVQTKTDDHPRRIQQKNKQEVSNLILTYN